MINIEVNIPFVMICRRRKNNNFISNSCSRFRLLRRRRRRFRLSVVNRDDHRVDESESDKTLEGRRHFSDNQLIIIIMVIAPSRVVQVMRIVAADTGTAAVVVVVRQLVEIVVRVRQEMGGRGKRQRVGYICVCVCVIYKDRLDRSMVKLRRIMIIMIMIIIINIVFVHFVVHSFHFSRSLVCERVRVHSRFSFPRRARALVNARTNKQQIDEGRNIEGDERKSVVWIKISKKKEGTLPPRPPLLLPLPVLAQTQMRIRKTRISCHGAVLH